MTIRPFMRATRLVLRHHDRGTIELAARPTRTPAGVFVPGDPHARMEESIDSDTAIETFNEIFGRLGMTKQAARRATRELPCFYVVAWSMPPTMEVAELRNLPQVWQRLSSANSWPAAVL